MKRCSKWLVAMAWVTLAFSAYGGGLESLRARIGDAERYARERRKNEAGDLVDILPRYSHEPEFRALQRELSKSWRLALAHLDELAPDEMSKTLVLCSCWYMDEDEFGTFLLEVARLTDEGKVSPRVFRWCQWPFESPLQGYLQRHAKDTAVREVEQWNRKIYNEGAEPVDKEESANSPETEGTTGTIPPCMTAFSETGGKKPYMPIVWTCLAFSCGIGIWLLCRKPCPRSGLIKRR
ncbi:MAG: hypothetical protein IJT88_03830 [Kiritimatiellae bacterium]|nr:hypothetical protein [Kiritimatiellia bacterium]